MSKPTQEQVIAWAREAGVFTGGHPMNPWSVYPSDLKKIAALAYEAGRKDENEECVRTVSDVLYGKDGCGKAIDAIRARREQ